ncbi:MAG: family 43 glycosylhydrolase [Prevotella sp.]|nr:family 43 glycosylhydrolase [Prevotella sp.]
MKRYVILLLSALVGATTSAQTELTSTEAKTLYSKTSKSWTSIHDPSVVYNHKSGRYYIFGSHKAGAYTTDFQNWTQANPSWTPNTNAQAFVTPAVKTVKKGGVDVDFPQFNAVDWSAKSDAAYNIDGNMWAPDVIWNEKMQKWCMYLSINGDAWHSSIILLTASAITGPYKYQGPVVICGFKDSSHSYKDTDLELVLGKQSSLPSRYNVGNNWGRRWPHTIDPAVFYDEEGKLWLVYGSWSGGIWMLELDEETGLRDYDVTYPSTNGSSDGVTSDPYFGTKIAGGYYVSGEGPYIEHVGNYYYLFVSYGGFAPDGGYEMRVFRSEKPNGPYKDAGNRSAIFSSYVLNYGAGNDNRGVKIMGAYNQWGTMTVGECAQGHNSVIAAEDGRTYLVYHTKFNNGTAGHQVRTHQLFLNKNGWLVAAPFEYNGETTTDADIATKELVETEQIPGTYQLLIHKYKMDHAKMEEVTPASVTLNSDGTVTGDYKGTWTREAGTSYFTIKLNSINYHGVLINEQMDGMSMQTIAFTAMSTNGVNVWGYKYHPKYALAWQLNNQKVPVTNNSTFQRDAYLYNMLVDQDNVKLTWQSSHPEVISEYGKYNPYAISEDTQVTLSARLETPGYFWAQEYTVKALAAANAEPSADWQTGMLAHYGFDGEQLTNTFDANQVAELKRNSTTKLPELEEGDPMRTGNVAHIKFGSNGKESYISMPNPLYGQSLEEGATLSFWVKRTDNNLWDGLYGFVNGNARLYMTGNTYTGFNDGNGKWLDINNPSTVETNNLSVGQWHLVTIVFTRSATSTSGGVTVYIDAATTKNDKFKGEKNGTAVSTRAAFDYNIIVDHLSASTEFYLGRGSFWGSPDVCFDDVIVYNRPLKFTEVMALRNMANRVYDFRSLVEPEYKKGDVNKDGTVDVADISMVISVMAGSSTGNTDVNGDGRTDVADISNIISIMAGNK